MSHKPAAPQSSSPDPLAGARSLIAALDALKRLVRGYRGAYKQWDHNEPGAQRELAACEPETPPPILMPQARPQLIAWERIIGEWRDRNRDTLPAIVEHLRSMRVTRPAAVVMSGRSRPSALAWLVELGEHARDWILCDDDYLDQLDRRARWLFDELRIDLEQLAAEVSVDLHQWREPDERRQTPKRKHRRRATPRKSIPLTPEQTEAMQLVGEHKGNIAAAARAAGKSRAAMDKLYRKAMAKLGKKTVKHFTQRLPTDARGQETIAADEEE
jgi:hypothetical protein